MHPALSIIVFTTLSGLGYGLAIAVASGIAVAPEALAGQIGYALALALIMIGLLASTRHLGHPERAWRALSQWRSSWLSREGVAAVVTFAPLGLAAAGAIIFAADWRVAALLAALSCVFTVYCTSMIYASLKTVHHWHTALTALVFVALAFSGGFVWLAALTAIFGAGAGPAALFGIVFLTLAAGLKLVWWRRADRESGPSTIESATGLGFLGPVRLLEKPHTGQNYLVNEMGFRVARKHATKLRRIAVVFGFVLPLLALIVAALLERGALVAGAAIIGAVAHLGGILVERWLFFAEARHTVMLYYGDKAA